MKHGEGIKNVEDKGPVSCGGQRTKDELCLTDKVPSEQKPV